jgi:putative hydrolase of the HAD superfamily
LLFSDILCELCVLSVDRRTTPNNEGPRTSYHSRVLPAAVIFDFDGIVLDSETPEYESHRRIYERCGATLTVDEWCAVIGTWSEGHDERWMTQLAERSASAPSREEYHAERRITFAEIVPREPMRGIGDFLNRLADAQIPVAIASSAPARWVIGAVESIGLTQAFRTIVTGDAVANRKPAPDVYLEAARRLGVDPRRSIAIEDSSPGIAAAGAAGMTVIAIPHWLTAAHNLTAADLAVAHAGEVTLARLEALLDR